MSFMHNLFLDMAITVGIVLSSGNDFDMHNRKSKQTAALQFSFGYFFFYSFYLFVCLFSLLLSNTVPNVISMISKNGAFCWKYPCMHALVPHAGAGIVAFSIERLYIQQIKNFAQR